MTKDVIMLPAANNINMSNVPTPFVDACMWMFYQTIDYLFVKNLDVDNTSELLEFYNPYSRQFDRPTHWLDGRKPVIGIFCDDIQSSPLIGSKAFRHLCI